MRPAVEEGYARRAMAEIAKLREDGVADGTWPRHAVPAERLAEWEAARSRRDEAPATTPGALAHHRPARRQSSGTPRCYPVGR